MLRERPAHRATDAGTGLLREDVVRARYQFSELEHQSRARMVMPSFGAEQLPVPRAHVHLGGDIADRGGPFELWDADVNPNRAERHQHVDRGLHGLADRSLDLVVEKVTGVDADPHTADPCTQPRSIID